MLLYRAVPLAYAQNFSGRGQSYESGGRWNPPLFPVLYFATSPSLARMESANYQASPRPIPKSYVLAEYALPDNVELVNISQPLPADWDDYPYPTSTQGIGREWLTASKTLGLLVPSVTDNMGVDLCLVINPLHADITRLRYVRHATGLFGPRAFAGA